MLINRAKDAHVQSDAYTVGLSRLISTARRVGGFYAPTCTPRRVVVMRDTSRCFYLDTKGKLSHGFTRRTVFLSSADCWDFSTCCRAAARGNQSAGKRIREGVSSNRPRCGSFSKVALGADDRERPRPFRCMLDTHVRPTRRCATTFYMGGARIREDREGLIRLIITSHLFIGRSASAWL